MNFVKYHGLGNDYLVIEPSDVREQDLHQLARTVCHRNYGVGSDGILVGPYETDFADFSLRIINPDGSEAEKSGNGLRIFSRYLWETNRIKEEPFTIDTKGGVVKAQVFQQGALVRVEMGTVSFNSREIGITGSEREVINEEIVVDGTSYTYCAVTVGNPHCVVLDTEVTEAAICKLGPCIENDGRFINRTNVQLLEPVDCNTIRIQIWERGVGYTLASGSSSTAAAAVANKLGLVEDRVTVKMPGGELLIEFVDHDHAIMTGPVRKVCEGVIDSECINDTAHNVSFS